MQTTLRRQDRREQADVGQWPRASRERGVARQVCSATSRQICFVRLAFDTDEGDAVGTGNSTKTHSRQPNDARTSHLEMGRVRGRRHPDKGANRGMYLIGWDDLSPVGIACQHGGRDHANDRNRAQVVDVGDRPHHHPVRQCVHQRRRVPHSHAARRTRPRPVRGRPDVVAAELRHGGHPHRLGLHRRPVRRTHRARHRLRTHRRCDVRRGLDALPGRRWRIPVSRRHGGRQQQLCERPAGGRLVSARSARPGHGHPPDRDSHWESPWARW